MKELKSNALFSSIKELIEYSRQQVAVAVNASMSMLYWQIGRRIKTEILQNSRAGYGEQIVHTLSAQLRQEYGSGFSKRNLFNMIRFAEVFLLHHFALGTSAQRKATQSHRNSTAKKSE